MFHCYYKIDSADKIHEYTDDYNWNLNDDVERENLFTFLASDHYGYNSQLWNDKNYHDIILCDKDGKAIYTMHVEMYLEPTFEAYER